MGAGRRPVLLRPERTPKASFRLTDDRLELTARLIRREHGIRDP